MKLCFFTILSMYIFHFMLIKLVDFFCCVFVIMIIIKQVILINYNEFLIISELINFI